MDKTAIKNFATQARNILRAMAEKEAGFYGVTKDGCAAPLQSGADFETYKTAAGTENTIYGADIRRRASLKKAVETLGFEQVIEEAAYTWFNRIIAIRFMEVNDYLPTRVRVLSSENGGLTPDIVTHSLDVELHLSTEEQEKIQQAKDANKFDDAYRILFIKQCNELNDVLPGLFERTDDYMELLLKVSYTGDSVIRLLVDSVAEDNFNVETEGQVEIIGWMYQYYNSELKDDTFAKLKKNIKITKERIPAATQLFTPDWIVRYMVENSLGRVWIDHLRAVDDSVDERTKAEEYGWKYYLPEAEQEETVARELVEVRKSYRDITPQDITCIDPCMGSGHILVYMFDVLMDIYKSEGYSERDAIYDILEKNIFGLDIDRRAYQLSYFALMMKGRGYGGRRFLRVKEDENGNRIPPVAPHVYAIEESNSISRDQLQYYGAGLDEMSRNNAITQMNGLLDTLKDAKEYGSILNVENYDWELLRSFVSETKTDGQITLDSMGAENSRKLAMRLVEIGEVLARKYDAVVTNPPYMGVSNGSLLLSKYIKEKYQHCKHDMYAVFMERCGNLTSKNGFCAMITQHSWMFLGSYEELRERIYRKDIINVAHLGARAFDEISGEVVQTVSFVLCNARNAGYKGSYCRLVEGKSEGEKQELFFEEKCRYIADQDKYNVLSGAPLAYWVNKSILSCFDGKSLLGDKYTFREGIHTADNNRFLRLWHEIGYNKIVFQAHSYEDIDQNGRYVPYNKGGAYRRWYGNNDYVIMFDEKARSQMSQLQGHVRPSQGLYFKEGGTWSSVSPGSFSIRYYPQGYLFDAGGQVVVGEDVEYCIGYMNTNLFAYIAKLTMPTINYKCGIITNLPDLCISSDEVKAIVKNNIKVCEEDWDLFETSWGFEEHPLVRLSKDLWDATAIGASMHYYYGGHPEVSCPVELCYMLWQGECNERFKNLKQNEEELNRIFIDIYGLQDELTPEVEDKDITVRKADLGRDIRSLISYAVGCMFGRYSLAKPGLVYAGGKFDNSLYGDFLVDDDAIIPITDEAYFNDDIVGRFEEFIKVVYGADSLESNLKYIADVLGTKGSTSRDKIRNYFLNDFFKDHCNTYSVTGSGKRPIYWLFDSGKQNGFKALIYMHRYTPDTVGLVRSVYLKKASDAIEASLKNAEYIISENTSAVDVAQATKKRDKYVKQLAEIKPYYQALSHVAMQRIPLDLDDGVKVNYAKFQGIEVAEDGGKRQTVDLLAKI